MRVEVRRHFHPQGVMRPLLVVASDKGIEAGLLLQHVGRRGLYCPSRPVGEMVALRRLRMLNSTVDGRPFSEELQKLILGREFDRLGQEEGVRVLRGLEEIDDVVTAFGELRALRRKYLHFRVDKSVDIDADARWALQYAAFWS
jgi:hypothetical protein